MNKRQVFLSLVCASLFLTMVGQAVNVAGQTTSASGVFRMTLVVQPNSINPLTLTTGSSGGILIGMQYYGSPIPAPDGSLDSSVAVTDWISHNANYSTWMFNVKPGLKWSDGSSVTSQDILATFGPNFGFNATYDYLGMGPEVTSEYALNSSTAVFVLNTPDAHWPDKFNWDLYSPVYPAKFVNNSGAANNNFGTDVEVGPFYVSNYQEGQTQMVMLRNPYYSPQPTIQQIDINFVESLGLTTTYLQSGTTDLAPVEPSAASSVLKNTNMHILDEKGLYVSDLQYNDSIYPFNMTAFRQALAYGINQSDFINQAYNGYGVSAYNAEGVVSPLASAWYNPNIPKYSYNTTMALSLLRSVGITQISNGKLQYTNGTAVSLSLWTDTDNTEDTIGVTVVQSDLQNLGFNINLQTTSLANIVSDYGSNIGGIRSGIILTTANPPVWGNPYLDALPGWDVYWPATTPNHYWEYPPSANAEYQSNYSAFLATADTAQEQQYLNSIQSLNAQFLPTLVLAYPDALWGYNTQTWSNWPSGYIEYGAQIMNGTAFVNLQPASSSVGSPTNYTLIAGAIIAVIVIVGAGAFLYSRRKKR